jgi:malonyl-CoA decarboxylase
MPSFFNQLFRSIAERSRVLVDPRFRAVVARRNRVARLAEICHALIAEQGEPSGAALAMEALAVYSTLDEAGRAEFFDILHEEFSPRPEAVTRAMDVYREHPDWQTLAQLGQAVEPPRQELFRRMNMAPGGTAALVEMRGIVLQELARKPHRRTVEADLGHLLRSWFNRGFITLQRIDWHTPAHILEKLIRYEAVHEINGWDDLRRRLAADRRCFAFFHPALPDEPLIFVEVALLKGLAESVESLLDPDSGIGEPADADTAVFYSISDCQAGLHGISFGNFLIKQVAAELQAELPKLKMFATLSPVPGFRAWLEAHTPQIALLDGGGRLAGWLEKTIAQTGRRALTPGAEVRELLQHLCAYYLTRALRKDGRPLDAVARFHLRNGAQIERINWAADNSPRGLSQSAGIMVNYLYELDAVEHNHEAYVNEGRIAASRRVRSLARSLRWPAEQPAGQRQAAAGRPSPA